MYEQPKLKSDQKLQPNLMNQQTDLNDRSKLHGESVTEKPP